MTINRLVSKWCNPSISYQEILIFQGKFPSFNKTLTFHEQFQNNSSVLSHHQVKREKTQEENYGI